MRSPAGVGQPSRTHEYPAFRTKMPFRRFAFRSPQVRATWCVGATKATAALHIVERLRADLAMLERSDAL